MTHLPSDPSDFASQAIDGFVQTHPRLFAGLVRCIQVGRSPDGPW
ncbi:hypothetical protein [Cyanobium sp. Maggiore-St4-Cus]|nr:hypothetical protein [Cyanobium sp. Maggiore-St4-Cus]